MCWVLFSFQIGVFKMLQKEINDNFLMPSLDLQHVVDYGYYKCYYHYCKMTI
jgi:hypothetical protein